MTITSDSALSLSTGDDLIRALAPHVAGRVLVAGQPGYDELVTGFNVAVISRPAAVIEVLNPHDVVAVMRFAAATGYDVAVQATGHGAVARTRPTLMMHTGRLDELEIRADGTARIGAGVRWQAVLDAAAPLGLAPLAGSSPLVGVVGYTTGGGLGPVARSFGFASDYVTAFEVVTARGEALRVDATDYPELFWGLKGGKGALGIVTAVELRLIELPEIYGGCIFFDGADLQTVAQGWRSWSQSLPREASTSLAIMRLPAMPGVPEPLAGRCTVAVRFAFTGDPAVGERTFDDIRALAPVILGGAGVMPYAALGVIHNDPIDPMPIHETQTLLRELSAETVDALLTTVGIDTACPQIMVELRLLGGALATPASDSAVSHRDAAYTIMCLGLAIPDTITATLASANEIMASIRAWSTGGSLANFGASLSPARLASRYDRGTLERLARLAEYLDPNGILPEARAIRAAATLHD